MLEENVEIIILPLASEKTSSIPLITSLSLGVYPSFSALVESARRRSTPASPKPTTFWKSKSLSTGVKSILKSPLSIIVPCGVSIWIPKESGIE